MDQNGIIASLKGQPFLPVVTFQEKDDPVAFMEFLLNKEVACIEITLRTEAAWSAFTAIKKAYSDRVAIGAGTVVSEDQILRLKDLGIDFLVSPGSTPSLIDAMDASGLAYLPGAATPTEVMHLREKGLRALKFFPANLYGGLDALKAFGQLFPDVQFCPTGGINEQTSSDYLNLKNVFAVGGSWFQKKFSAIK